VESPPLFSAAPFAILLLAIAIMPLAWPRFWEKNGNKAAVCAVIGVPILIFLIARHPAELAHSMQDYVSFILLLFSLFVISGGILLTGDLRATPRVNTTFLLVGAVIANLIGTTGAAMLLIRPMLRTNSERKFTGHIPVFFIFVVANIGGCLTPLADPPLFLGYLKGVPFLWTLGLYPEWLIMLAVVLAVFFVWDTLAYRKEAAADLALDRTMIAPLRVGGLVNLFFVAGVVLAVAFRVPSPYREIVMLAMAILSLVFTRKELRVQNRFTFGPIVEVAILFAGIFVTMVPLLMLLHAHGAELGITRPWQFFWLTGGLSSFLDNAPTYLTFYSLAESVTNNIHAANATIVSGVQVDLLRAISCGAVFMGANTYIGNGPNFMVKAIAEEQGAKVPHFFGYMVYSSLILLPVFVLITWLFFV
jgi:Na+/H+ antiporter NhaD/arsenite permease-like protein